MPKLTGPDRNRRASLQAMAMDVVLESVLQFCEQLSVTGCVKKLRQGIAAIQKELFTPNAIPDHLLADFCSTFLKKFHRNGRRTSHHRAALEIIMDVEVPGLRCEGLMAAYLDRGDEDRFQGLKILDLNLYPRSALLNVQNFHLQNLTTFIYPYNCTNADLKVIGKNCPRLEVLEVRYSPKVSDKGLFALESHCLELRYLDVARCSVSDCGIRDFRKGHKKISHLEETLNVMYSGEYISLLDPVLLFFGPHRDSKVTGFVFENDVPCTNALLESLVDSFPNLKKFTIDQSSLGHVTEYYREAEYVDEGDLSILKSLNKLAVIDINLIKFEDDDELDIHGRIIDQSLEALNDLLSTSIGTNITTLKYRHYDQTMTWDQSRLDFIFDSCPNIQCLGFEYKWNDLLIPPFRKLKELLLYYPEIDPSRTHYDCRDLEIGFRKMVNLECLSAVDFLISFETVKSMIFDDVKFPKLTVIKTNGITTEGLAHIERIVYHNNFDFKIEQDQSSSTYNQLQQGVDFASDIIDNDTDDGTDNDTDDIA